MSENKEAGPNFIDKLKSLIGTNSVQNEEMRENEFSSLLSSKEFWNELANTGPEDRMKYIHELESLMLRDTVKRSDIKKIWIQTNDLLEKSSQTVTKDIRHKYLQFLVSFIKSQFAKLEGLRLIIFDEVVRQAGTDIEDEMLVIDALTESGTNIDLLELQVDDILFEWTTKLVHHQVFLNLLSNILKFSSFNLDPHTVHQVVLHICQSIEVRETVTSSLLLKVVDEIVCYGCLPLSALQQVVSTLSFVFYTQEELQDPTRKIFRNLLGGQLGFSVMERMFCLLCQRPTSGDHKRICGAVNLISWGLWSSIPVTNVTHMSHVLLSSLLQCLNYDDINLAYSVVLAVKNLVQNKGRELHVDSWKEVITLTEIISTRYMPLARNAAVSKSVVCCKRPELIYEFHELITSIEKLVEAGHLLVEGDVIDKLFAVIESVITHRPESSLIMLLKHKTSTIQHGDKWCAMLNQIFNQFLDTTMSIKVRCKAIETITTLFRENFHLYEPEIVDDVMSGRCNTLVEEESDLVRNCLLEMLFELAARAQPVNAVRLLGMLDPFIVTTLRRDLLSSVSLCINFLATKTDKVLTKSLPMLMAFLRNYHDNDEDGEEDGEVLHRERIDAYKTLMANQRVFGDSKDELKADELFACITRCISTETYWPVLSSVMDQLNDVTQGLVVERVSRDVFDSLIEQVCKLFTEAARVHGGSSSVEAAAGIPHEVQLRVVGVLRGASVHRRLLSVTRQRLTVRTLDGGFITKSCKLCISAVTLCLVEFDSEALHRILPTILLRLSQMSATVSLAPFVLEFLSTLSQLPDLYKGFGEEQYKSLFAIALQHTYTDKFSIYVVSLAQYIVCNWFVKCRDKFKSEFVSHITRILHSVESKDVKKSVQNNLVESCLDLMASYMHTSEIPGTSPSRFEEGGNSITWMLGNRLVTISTEQRGKQQVEASENGGGASNNTTVADARNKDLSKENDEFWASIEIRRPCGHTSWHIASKNIKSFLSSEQSAKTASAASTAAPSQNEAEDGFPRKRSSTISTSNEYKMKKPALHPLTSPASLQTPISPEHVFLQLFYSSIGNNTQNRPLLIPNSVRLSRALQLLDITPAYDTWSTGVCYVRRGQGTDGKSIVLNQHGSTRYQRFLSSLGNLICLNDCDERRSFLGGLDYSKGADGAYTYIWQEKIMQMVFHVATLMPNHPSGDITYKTRHIGNDYVLIVFDEGSYVPHSIIKGQFLMVEIVIKPVEDRPFFRVSLVFHKPEVEEMLNVPAVRYVSEPNLGLVVKQLCLYANMASNSFRHKGQPDQVTSKTTARLRHIKRIRNHALDELSKSDPQGAARYHKSDNTLDQFTDYVKC